MIAPRVRDVYVLDMTSSAQESCFFAKAYENLNWLWHKRLAHLNFKTINILAKQNLIIALPSLVHSKTNRVHNVKKESIIEPASKQNRHLLSRNVFIFFTWIYLDLYPPDEYLHPYESPKPVVLGTKVSSDPNGQADQNDHSVQTDEMLNDDQAEHSN
ncbi:retrovirus-related pol polyprotein from transposon TNT 1-94 [Tanacetum coccineum]